MSGNWSVYNRNFGNEYRKFFINLGRKLGTAVNKGRWYYKSLFGREDEAIEAEYMMGKTLAANIGQEMMVLNDPALQNMLDEVGGKLVQKVVNKKRKLKFQAVATKEINVIFCSIRLLRRALKRLML